MASASLSLPANPVPIQVVFQGGGAKLCVLLAVCDVLERYQGDRVINITRVAGSSAGAIAAIIMASGDSISTYKERLVNIAPNYMRNMKTMRWLGAWRVFRGKAYFKSMNLEDVFERIFQNGQGLRLIGELAIDSEVYFTDLYSLQARVAPPDESIVKALAKSCRFPFAFSGFDSGNTEVDGGLALNLPVDSLKKDESKKGSVIGIAFKEKFGRKKEGLLSFTQQLFSASIHSGVLRSEAILGPQNVFSIDTDIGTFDFEAAVNEGLGVHYELVKAQFTTWLDGWLKAHAPDTGPGLAHPPRMVRPPLSNIPLSASIIRELDDRLKSEPATKAISLWSCEFALIGEDGNFNGKYMTRTTMKFTVSRPVYVLQFDFQAGKSGSFMSSNLGCSAMNSKGDALNFTPDVQEITGPGDHLRRFRVYFLFDKRLTPDSQDQPYVVEYQYEADDPYPNLGSQAEASTLIRWQGDAEEATLAVGFPRQKVKAQPEVTDITSMAPDQLKEIGYEIEGERLISSQELPLLDFLQFMGLDHPPQRYFLVARRAHGISQGEGFGFVIE